MWLEFVGWGTGLEHITLYSLADISVEKTIFLNLLIIFRSKLFLFGAIYF